MSLYFAENNHILYAVHLRQTSHGPRMHCCSKQYSVLLEKQFAAVKIFCIFYRNVLVLELILFTLK